jgi:hypothetical protein
VLQAALGDVRIRYGIKLDLAALLHLFADFERSKKAAIGATVGRVIRPGDPSRVHLTKPQMKDEKTNRRKAYRIPSLKICSEPNCGKPVQGKGLCAKHYYRKCRMLGSVTTMESKATGGDNRVN